MRCILRSTLTLTLGLLTAQPAAADSAQEGFAWLSQTDDIMAEGLLWNDRFGDGQDRYKTGGMTQSWVFPENIFSDTNWFADRASAIELNGRGLIVAPENTAVANPNDRAHGQYVGVGLYLRSVRRPRALGNQASVSAEERVGIELGYQGDPLPVFDIQDALHDASGAQGRMNRTNVLDEGFHANIEARRTYRFHVELQNRDVQVAPYVQGSLGTREISLRVGGDLIVGSALAGRTWNMDPAIGALIPGGTMPREGWNWMTWIGGDIGVIGHDAFLDGDSTLATTIEREPVAARIRAGIMVEYDNFALSYGLNWLSPEFDSQPQGQLVGSASIKYRF